MRGLRLCRGPEHSAEPAGALQDLDLVAVGVLDEEEPAEGLAVVGHLLDVLGREALAQDARPLGVEIVDDESEMPVARPGLVGLGAALVDGELELEVGFRALAGR